MTTTPDGATPVGRQGSDAVTFDLYVWKAPRDLDAEAAGRRIASWQAAGGDPTESPFEPSTDVGWFYRELMLEGHAIAVTSDAVPSPNTRPIWLSTDDAAPARVVAIALEPTAPRDAVDSILGLAAKYDMVVFEAGSGRLRLPLEELADDASATFWPAGAIQAAVAGVAGALLAIVAWFLSITVVSGIAIVIGGFMAVMSVYTFIHEARRRRDAGLTPRQ